MNIGERGIALIKSYEKCVLDAYKPTPDDVWTIGYGHTGDDVTEGLSWTQDQADAAFLKDIEWVEDCINEAVTLPLIQPEFDALCSFVFNEGCGHFGTSTLLKRINEADLDGAAQEFLRWNKQGSKVLDGLTARRKAEKELFERTA